MPVHDSEKGRIEKNCCVGGLKRAHICIAFIMNSKYIGIAFRSITVDLRHKPPIMSLEFLLRGTL